MTSGFLIAEFRSIPFGKAMHDFVRVCLFRGIIKGIEIGKYIRLWAALVRITSFSLHLAGSAHDGAGSNR